MAETQLPRKQRHPAGSGTAHTNIPERTLKRRFKAATGTTLIEYLQNLRIEEAKRLLDKIAGSDFERTKWCPQGRCR